MVLTGWKLRERKWANTTERLTEDLELECTQYVFDLNTSWRKFSKVSSRRYIDGHVDIFDMVDIDLFSVIVLNRMVLQLGYTGEFEPMYYNYLRLLSTLDEGLYALACSEIYSYGLSRDESFRVDKLDLNVNLTGDLNVSQTETQAEVSVFEEADVGRIECNLLSSGISLPQQGELFFIEIEEHIIEHVIVEEVIDGSSEEDVEQGNGQEAVKAHSDEQVDYDVEGIDSAYETQYHVESSEDVRTDDDDDDDFLVDEENEIVEPDVDVHLFGTRKDVPCDNIGVTNLVPNDVLEIEGSTLFWRFVRIIQCASGLSFLTAVCLIRQREKIMESTFQSIDEGPFKMRRCRNEIASGTDALYLGLERDRVVADLSQPEKDRLRADIRATNILLQVDQCDAFDFDVDEAPTAQTMFMANLSFVAPVYDEAGPSYDSNTLPEVQNHDNYLDDMKESHEEHEMQNDVQPNDVIDSDTEYTSSKDTLEIAETTKRQMIEKMKNLEYVKKKAKALKEKAKSAKPITAMTVGNTIRELKEKNSRLTKKINEAHPILDFKALDSQNKDLTVKVNAIQDLNERFRAKNEKVKQYYKELYDSIKLTRVKTIEKTTYLLDEIENLKAQLKEKMKCVIVPAEKPKVLAPGMYAIDVKPIPPRNRNNREVHLDYLKHLKESVATLRKTVEEARVEKPLDISLASACRYTKHSQELLEYAIGTRPKDLNARDKKLASITFTKKKKVTFKEPCETSTQNTPTHPEQQKIKKTNEHVIPSTGIKGA
nr:hypothetical protein [Tanacetum cinerariifolium]